MPRNYNPGSKPPEVFFPVGMAGGLNTKTDRKLVQPPNVLDAADCRVTTGGSVRKRFGLQKLSGITMAITTLCTNNELLVCDSGSMYGVDVGSGTLFNRGSVGAASVASMNLYSIGNVYKNILRTIQYETVQVGSLTYGLTAWEFASPSVPGPDGGSSITLALSNALTGSILWTMTVPTGVPVTSGGATWKFLGAANPAPTVTAGNSTGGTAYPVIAPFNNKFYISWVGCMPSSTVVDGGTTITGNLYYAPLFSFTPSTTPPSLDYTQTNCSINGSVPCVIEPLPGTGNSYNTLIPMPLYFDLRTSGNDLLFVCNGQNYSNPSNAANSGAINAITYRSPTAYVWGTNLAAAVIATTFALAPTTAQMVTLAPGTGLYGLFYAGSALAQLIFPNFTSGTVTLSTSLAPNVTNIANQISFPTGAVFSPSMSSPSNLVITDGYSIFNYSLTYSTPGNPATASFAALPVFSVVTPDYAHKNGATVVGSAINGQLASRPFIFNGQPVAWMMLTGYLRATFCSLVLMPLVAGVPSVVARAAYNRCSPLGFPPSNNYNLVNPFNNYLAPRQAAGSSVNPTTSQPTTAYYSLVNQQENTATIKSLSVVGDTLGTPRRWVKTPQGALYLGADPKYYDGSTCRSMGWLTTPEILCGPGVGGPYIVNLQSVSGYSSGGYLPPQPATPAGLTLGYFFVWVDYDAQGNTIYSSPSPQQNYTIPSSGNYGLAVPVVPTCSPTRGALQLYRNTYAAPSIFVKVNQFNAQSQQYTISGSQFWIDDYNGPIIATGSPNVEQLSGGLLYAPPNGGELANDPPPSAYLGAATKQRIFLVSQENPTWVYFSKPFFPGRAPEFNAGQFIDIDPPSGPITGIATLDTTVIIFKQQSVYIFAGDGPDATGSGSFTPTSLVSTDAGCVDPGSTLTTQDGVYFRSRRGLQLIDRGLQIQYPGAMVEPNFQAAPITSSTIVTNQSQLRFAQNNMQTLVYDYTAQAWTRYRFLRPDASNTFTSVVSSVFFNGNYYLTNSNGDLAMESTLFVDGSSPINMQLVSAWIPVAGPQGWGRIRRVAILGDFQSAHTLTMGFSYDYNDSVAYSIPYTASTTGQKIPYNWRVRAPRQVCQAVKITLTDGAPAGEGAIITGLVLELGPKSQALRVPDTQSV